MATILFLAHRIPYPPNKGDKLRAYHVLNHWTKQHTVFLGCFIDDPEDLQYRDRLRERCAGTYFARLHPKLATMRAFTRFLTQSPLSVPYYHDRGLGCLGRPRHSVGKARLRFRLFLGDGSICSRRYPKTLALARGLRRCRFREVGRLRGNEDISRPTNLSS